MDQAGGKAKEGADAMRRFLARLEENSKLDTADKIARIAREEGAPVSCGSYPWHFGAWRFCQLLRSLDFVWAGLA